MLKCRYRKQDGAVLILVGIVLFALLGMAGLVIDLGSLYVAKTEVQSAMDSCALSAAQELDGANDALTRATNAGLTVGNANKVGYQKASVQVTGGEITYSDSLGGSYSSNFTPVANASYAKCTHTTSGILAYFIELVGGASTNSVAATAVATRAHSQSSCAIPIGALPKVGGTAPDYGYTVGEWVNVYPDNSGGPGTFGIYNLDGSTDANETKKEMSDPGYCGTKVGDAVGDTSKTPGAKTSIIEPWNRRFGIYKNNGDPATQRPDKTGYAYTAKNWGKTSDAYSGIPGATADATAANFKTKRLAYANYASNDADTKVSSGDAITGLSIDSGGYKKTATGGAPPVSGQHYQYGKNARIVAVPVISSTNTILDFLCVLMLQPIDPNLGTYTQFEYIGNASNGKSPCITNGLAGGSYGPLVSALVQ